MNPDTTSPNVITLRSRLRKIVSTTAELDTPKPPTPTHAEPPLLFMRDRIHNPQGQTWAAVLPNLDVLEGIFPESLWHKVRFVTHLEHAICRDFNSIIRRRYPLPCEGRGMLALIDTRLRLQTAERPNNTEYAYLTVADYPEWLVNDTKRGQAFSDYALTQRFGV